MSQAASVYYEKLGKSLMRGRQKNLDDALKSAQQVADSRVFYKPGVEQMVELTSRDPSNFKNIDDPDVRFETLRSGILACGKSFGSELSEICARVENQTVSFELQRRFQRFQKDLNLFFDSYQVNDFSSAQIRLREYQVHDQSNSVLNQQSQRTEQLKNQLLFQRENEQQIANQKIKIEELQNEVSNLNAQLLVQQLSSAPSFAEVQQQKAEEPKQIIQSGKGKLQVSSLKGAKTCKTQQSKPQGTTEQVNQEQQMGTQQSQIQQQSVAPAKFGACCSGKCPHEIATNLLKDNLAREKELREREYINYMEQLQHVESSYEQKIGQLRQDALRATDRARTQRDASFDLGQNVAMTGISFNAHQSEMNNTLKFTDPMNSMNSGMNMQLQNLKVENMLLKSGRYQQQATDQRVSMEDVLKERDVLREVLEQKDQELKLYQTQIEQLMSDVTDLGQQLQNKPVTE